MPAYSSKSDGNLRFEFPPVSGDVASQRLVLAEFIAHDVYAIRDEKFLVQK